VLRVETRSARLTSCGAPSGQNSPTQEGAYDGPSTPALSFPVGWSRRTERTNEPTLQQPYEGPFTLALSTAVGLTRRTERTNEPTLQQPYEGPFTLALSTAVARCRTPLQTTPPTQRRRVPMKGHLTSTVRCRPGVQPHNQPVQGRQPLSRFWTITQEVTAHA
jgi:hypothetical protein